jgi:uncharacterized protein (TIGR03437 family)
MNPGDGIRMITDGLGNSLVLANSSTYGKPGYIAKIAPDGTVVSQQPFLGGGTDIAFGDAGSFWVAQGTIVQKFGPNADHVLDSPLQGFNVLIRAIGCDVAGNLYVAATEGYFGMAVFKITATGNLVASYHFSANAVPESLAVDSSGAVYVTGQTTDSNFPTTPGAFMESNPTKINVVPRLGDAFVMKLSSGLETMIYSTLIGGDGDASARVIVVDGAGNAFVGGYGMVAGYLPMKPFPASPIGVPIRASDGYVAYVLKLNSTGSGLMYSAGLCGGEVVSMALAPDGSIHAVAAVGGGTNGITAGVFTIGAAGDRVQRGQFLNGIDWHGLSNRPSADINIGADGALRVLTHITSTRFPVVWGESLPRSPIVIDLPAVPVQANVSISVAAKSIAPPASDLIQRVSLQNLGPGDAESILVDGEPNLSCSSDGIFSLSGGHLLIPRIPAGGTVWVECHEEIDLIALNLTKSFTRSVSVLALSSDTDFTNNSADTTVPITAGYPIMFAGDPFDFYFYRSDHVGRCRAASNRVRVANFPITVTAPTPQRWNGNWWYFDSWSDGVTDNPRVFNSAADAKSPLTMQFHPAQIIGADPPSLDLIALPGSTPLPRSITLYRPLGPAGKWSIGEGDTAWLNLTGTQPNADGTATVTAQADVSGLSPGYYVASFPAEFDVPGRPPQGISVPVSLRILDKPPSVPAGGIVDVASYRSAPLSPQELITIYGTDLGPELIQGGMLPADGQVPTLLGGTRVLFNGIPAPLLYVQASQIGAIVPNSISGSGTPGLARPLQVTVELGGVAAATANIGFLDYSPGLFTADGSGHGGLAALNQDGTVNSAIQPAERGSVLTLYGTGFAGADIQAAPGSCGAGEFGNNLPATVGPIDAYVGGRPAEVVYAGSIPGTTCSIQRVDLVVPRDSPTGPAVAVVLRVADVAQLIPAQDGLTIAVR